MPLVFVQLIKAKNKFSNLIEKSKKEGEIKILIIKVSFPTKKKYNQKNLKIHKIHNQ